MSLNKDGSYTASEYKLTRITDDYDIAMLVLGKEYHYVAHHNCPTMKCHKLSKGDSIVFKFDNWEGLTGFYLYRRLRDA